MTLRQKLACVGLTVFGLQIASAAAGGAPLSVGCMDYDIVLVPACETLRASTLERLEALSFKLLDLMVLRHQELVKRRVSTEWLAEESALN